MKTEKSKGFSTLIAIVTILVVGIIVDAGIYLYANQTEEADTPLVLINKNGDEAVWKIYRSEDFEISFKYPENWATTTNNNSITLDTLENYKKIESNPDFAIIPNGIGISWYEKSADGLKNFSSLENRISTCAYKDDDSNEEKIRKLKIVGCEPMSNAQKITFAGKEAWEVTTGGHGSNYTIYVENGGHLYLINFYNAIDKSKLSDIDKQIIDSFEFL